MTSNTETPAPTKTERKQRSRIDRTVMFPVASPKIEAELSTKSSD